MKPLFTIILAFATTVTFAQKFFQGKATYMSKTTMDMSRFGNMSEQEKKQRLARMKNFLEKPYTLTFNKTASSFKEEVNSSEQVLEIEEPTKGKEVSRDEYNKIVKAKTEELKVRFQNRGQGRSRN